MFFLFFQAEARCHLQCQHSFHSQLDLPALFSLFHRPKQDLSFQNCLQIQSLKDQFLLNQLLKLPQGKGKRLVLFLEDLAILEFHLINFQKESRNLRSCLRLHFLEILSRFLQELALQSQGQCQADLLLQFLPVLLFRLQKMLRP